MARWTKYLTNLLPRTGRIIAEDGTSENEADIARFNQLIDIAATSVNGTLYRGFFQGTIANGVTRDMVLSIPEGIDVYGFVRTSQARDQTITTRFLTCTAFAVTGDVNQPGLSLDRRAGRKSTAQATIREASALTDPLIHSPEIELSVVTATATKSAAIQTDAGALPAFDSTEMPVFRYTNTSGSAARYAFYLFWAEVPQA